MKRIRSHLILLLIYLSLGYFWSSCGSSTDSPSKEGDLLEGEISISGAFALYPMATKWAEEYQKLHPRVRINISAGGAGKGMADVLAGMVDLAMFSRAVSPEETAQGAYFVAVARDAVLPTISAKNAMLAELKQKGLSKTQFEAIFIKKSITSWGQLYGRFGGASLNVFTRSDACGAAEMWAKYLGKKQEDLQGVGVYGDPGMASAVKADAAAIGFNNLNYVFDMNTRKKYEGLEVIPIDINDNGIIDSTERFYENMDELITAIRTGVYPSPPARDLYFVSKGKPGNPIVVDFLKWILEDGQRFVDPSGYVQLPDKQVEAEHKKLD
jgi:phosphate transport system substrate-binding protein